MIELSGFEKFFFITCSDGYGKHTPTTIAKTDLDQATKRLWDIFKEEHPKISDIESRFIQTLHIDHDLVPGIVNIDGFIPVCRYPRSAVMMQNEIGAIRNFRVIVNSVGTLGQLINGKEVYQSLATLMVDNEPKGVELCVRSTIFRRKKK